MTRVAGIVDGAGAYRKSATKKANLTSWNMEKVYNNHAAFSNLSSQNIGIEKLIMTAAGNQRTNLKLYQMDQAYDNSQHYFLAQAGTENPNVLELLDKNRREIRDEYSGFRGFYDRWKRTYGAGSIPVLLLPDQRDIIQRLGERNFRGKTRGERPMSKL